jgi:hypothetical protein
MAKEAAKIENQRDNEQVKLNDAQKSALEYLFKEHPARDEYYILESGECFDNHNLALNAVAFDSSKITLITREMFNALTA